MKGSTMTLTEEWKALDEERKELERERKAFQRHVEIEDKRLAQQKNLFESKFRILEEEMIKVAEEKAEIEKKKAFYDMVDEFQAKSYRPIGEPQIVSGELFFVGVANQQSLKKRYKELIKIYHPDNIDGDNNTVLEINKEYQYLSQVLA